MTLVKILTLFGLGIVAIKFIASLFGQGNLPIFNRLVTLILGIFVAFELFKLGQIVLEKFI
jgi:uncharacterized membrane protein (DUF373 family)